MELHGRTNNTGFIKNKSVNYIRVNILCKSSIISCLFVAENYMVFMY